MESLLAALPPVHEVLGDPAFQAAAAELAGVYRTRLARRVIQQHRERIRAGDVVAEPRAAVVAACVAEAEALARPFPRRVVNGTGVLIHTNLGRAPLGELLTELDAQALSGYTDLEWDAATQQRGSRDAALQRQLRLLTGAEEALVVNNCASALLLALNTLAAGRDVLVSRSELVEIGGSFRVPDIMRASGCRLTEVGTTNRTRASDFEEHAGGAAALLKVHQSNFVQRGFVEQVGVDEMVALGARLGVPVVEDNGSGLIDAPGGGVLDDEPRVAASVRAGVDVVCCSADKLFGGVQAGIVVGRTDWLAAMRRNPLYRVLRLDKVRMGLLDAALRRYLRGGADELPLWRLFHAPLEELEARVRALRLPGPETRWAACARVPLRATLGGGSNPEATFESVGLELRHRDLPAEALRRHFAARAVPIVGYVQRDRFLLDLRTCFPHDLPELQAALDELCG
jgi:L-seryl-tRNA(Ser) seleniumtransferase